MAIALTAQIPKANGRAPEDRVWANDVAAAVADGVTRTPRPPAPYPTPSPAALAAETIIETAIHGLRNGRTPQQVLVGANEVLAELNASIGLSARYKAGEDDLAGAVAAAIKLEGDAIAWAYIGDCGIAYVSMSGALVAITPDDIEPLRAHFPPVTEPAYERMSAIRSQFRNNASGTGFGVLTGEQEAARYVRFGRWPAESAGLLLAFSDGARPMLADQAFRTSLVMAGVDSGGVAERLQGYAETNQLKDEASLAVIKIKGVS